MSDQLLRHLARLAEDACRSGPTAEAIADIVWMARYLEVSAGTSELSASGSPGSLGGADEPGPSPSQGGDHVVSGRVPDQVTDSIEFHPISTVRSPGDEATTGRPAITARVPAVTALPDSLAIGRALRPLKQRVDMPGRMRLDEEATAASFGETAVILPVYRLATERWLQVDLVVDTSASMAVWQQTVGELCALLEHHGAFRDVRTWAVDGDELNPALHQSSIGSTRQASSHSPAELADPRGRRAVLVVTDAVGAGWHAGAMADCLATWARSCPLAIVELLPRRLWYRTALRPATVTGLMQPGDRPPFRITRLDDALTDPQDESTPHGCWVPVLYPNGEWLGPWAAMVASNTARPADLFAIRPRRIQANTSREHPARPAEAVRRFRDLDASPEAIELASYLAAAPLSLPVMRLVQHAMMPHSRPEHLAEVFLSGMLRRVSESAETDPDAVIYEFRDGIREQLLAGLTRIESLHVLDVLSGVSGALAQRFGGTLDFRALAARAGESGRRSLPAASIPFARVAAEVLRGVGGRYAELAASLAGVAQVMGGDDQDDHTTRIAAAMKLKHPRGKPVATELSPQEWGARYSAYRDWYEWQTERLAGRIVAILGTAGIDVFNVESRTKEVQSFIGKIEARNSSKEAKFGDPLREITDLVGVRIITYNLEDIEAVGSIIQRNFQVDKAVTVDKAGDEIDRFGYKSVHYIVRISPPTSDTRDWGPYTDVRAEIQVRTALQHAWSAVQNLLDYKSEIAIPKKLQRRLYALNAVIESADLEFSKLRDERARIESSYKQDVQEGRLGIPLDEASLTAYVQDRLTGDRIAEMLAFRSDANIGKLDSKRLARDRRDLLSVLRWYNITTVAQLDDYLTANILPATIPDGFFGDDRRSMEDALTILILTDKRADRETYSKIYIPDGWNEFRSGIEAWRRQKDHVGRASPSLHGPGMSAHRATTPTRAGKHQGLAGHAFISYVREDSAHADRLQAILETAGVRVWRDAASLWPGEDWRARIRNAIKNDSLVFLACFSVASTVRDRSYRNEELAVAIEQVRLRRRDVPWLIPIRLDDCAIPDLDIGAGRTLRSINHVDLFGPQSGQGFTMLVGAVLSVLG